jgi:hypothetical protein
MTNTNTLAEDVRALLREVRVLCTGLDADLPEEIGGVQEQFNDDELRQMLTNILVLIRSEGEPAEADRDRIAAEVRSIVEAAVARRADALERLASFPESDRVEAGHANVDDERSHLPLTPHGGVQVRPVLPTPIFLGQPIQLEEGFVSTRDIAFWQNNKRLRIDLENFRRKEGRDPDPDELKRMLSPKDSTTKGDPYKIGELAADIAARGVLTPPVIDFWGTAWDGNRRLAACLYILHNDEFSDTEKARAAKIRVWQTDEHATEDQIQSIVTSLNFGEDFKLPWPEFVRAREVADAVAELRDNLQTRHTTLSDKEDTDIRRRVGKKFGIRTDKVTRYCKLVTWAEEFEDYHREQDRDENEIATRTAELTQYFVELDAGRGDDKLATKFKDDESFRAIVFDLLFDDKIKNWSQVRELRRVYETPDALDQLKAAHREPDRAQARQNVVNSVDLARQKSLAQRRIGRGAELGRIAKWLREDVTLAVLSTLDVDVLREFRDAARAVDGMISQLVDAVPSTPPSEAS